MATKPRSEAGPRHVAIIMDGNGRWAQSRGRPRLFGHHAGARRVREIVAACPDLGVEYLTIFAFSTENWKRTQTEVAGLMSLFRRYIIKEMQEFVREDVRVRFIGDRYRLEPGLRKLMEEAEQMTAHCTRLNLTIAINYGGRDEVARATKRLAQDVADGRLDPAEVDHCGSCRACVDVCPTDAFPAPYQLDARRCISYLTIEHKGPVDEALRPGLGNRIYGCDDCLAVCPWNKFAVEAREVKYHARDDLVAPGLAELAVLDDAGFRARFSGSPIKRIGRDRFVRNVLYAIGNSGEPRLREVALGLCGDANETVADAARWAVKRLDHAANGLE